VTVHHCLACERVCLHADGDSGSAACRSCEQRIVPVATLSLKKTAAANVNIAGRYDTFAMCDCIIYIDLMGRITTRI
jgi:hypothetical protein